MRWEHAAGIVGFFGEYAGIGRLGADTPAVGRELVRYRERSDALPVRVDQVPVQSSPRRSTHLRRHAAPHPSNAHAVTSMRTP